ncbi:MAG: DUF6768 family protein [Verrucomicrobiota bacterium]
MNDIDDKIRAALGTGNDGQELVPEPHLAEELLIAFRGRSRWITVLAVALTLVTLGLGTWCLIRCLNAEEVKGQMLWGGGFMLCFLYTAFMKVWFWLELHSNRVLREIKRVELLLLSRTLKP